MINDILDSRILCSSLSIIILILGYLLFTHHWELSSVFLSYQTKRATHWAVLKRERSQFTHWRRNTIHLFYSYFVNIIVFEGFVLYSTKEKYLLHRVPIEEHIFSKIYEIQYMHSNEYVEVTHSWFVLGNRSWNWDNETPEENRSPVTRNWLNWFT